MQLRDCDPSFIRNHLSVIGERIVYELRGVSCIGLEKVIPKKNIIVGKKVDVVLKELDFLIKKVSLDVSKTVKSAISNAENNNQLDIDNLIIKEAYVGKSIVMKRFRTRAKGTAAPIKNLIVELLLY